LLQELDEDLLNTAPGGIEKHVPVRVVVVTQPILVAVVLDAVCWALLFELQVYWFYKEEELLRERALQIWKDCSVIL